MSELYSCEAGVKAASMMQKILYSLQKVIQQFEDFHLLPFLMPRCMLCNTDRDAPSLPSQTC